MSDVKPYDVRPNDVTTAEMDESSGVVTFNVPNKRVARLLKLGLAQERRERERREARKRQKQARRRQRSKH